MRLGAPHLSTRFDPYFVIWLRYVLIQRSMQPRIRYNSKARSSHKRKTKRERDKSDLPEQLVDPNATNVAPKSEEEREHERKVKMREEVCMYASPLLDHL